MGRIFAMCAAVVLFAICSSGCGSDAENKNINRGRDKAVPPRKDEIPGATWLAPRQGAPCG
ncbi:MAG: hypothetical protein IT429_24915 [Gemmataceae bacterium]|nr:hypothetical protein [Gemmataceae bacterium]